MRGRINARAAAAEALTSLRQQFEGTCERVHLQPYGKDTVSHCIVRVRVCVCVFVHVCVCMCV